MEVAIIIGVVLAVGMFAIGLLLDLGIWDDPYGR